jgi:hypothetical protein
MSGIASFLTSHAPFVAAEILTAFKRARRDLFLFSIKPATFPSETGQWLKRALPLVI